MDYKREKQDGELGDVSEYQVDGKGRRFSMQNGEYVDASGRRFSGYDDAGRRVSVVDDVFGEIKEGGPNYRDVGDLLPSLTHALTS